MTEARSITSQQALDIYNDVQLCHEMGWTQAQLMESDDDFIWACLNVLDLESQKAARDAEDSRRGYGPRAKPGTVEHHRASAPPERVP